VAANIFSLEVVRARKGDCLLLHYGTKEQPRLGLIDGGPSGVYEPFLRPRLEALRNERGLGETEGLPLDFLMLSHIDDDHVHGLLQLTQELVEAQDTHQRQFARVLDLWHNSFDDIIGNDAADLATAVQNRFGPASLTGDIPEDAGIDVDACKVLANVPQGRRLRDDAKKLGVDRNADFEGGLIVANSDSTPIEMGDGLRFTVVGPMLREVENLLKVHDEWVQAHPNAVKAPEAALAAYADKSVPNLSSIVVLAKVSDKSILFTGDARGDKILEGLELVGLVKKGGTLHVDLLKCPHHGSSNNVDSDFFERIVADHYVFSGDGEHGNPERETLKMLADARDKDKHDYRIHLTYPVDEIDAARKKEAAKHKHEWVPAQHSIAAFLAANPEVKKKVVVILDPEHPHIIDLAG
jgi:hypothetical protein